MTEKEARQWIRKIVEVLRQGSELTPFEVDDRTCEVVLKAIDSDLFWGYLWKLISRWLEADEPIVVSAEAAPVVEAINPIVVITVVKLIIDLWKTLRNG